jgi:hypothetical protein
MIVRNFWADWRVSCDWACHIARGSGGGTDYAVGVGTPIYASFDGVLTNRPPVQYPNSGNTAILTAPNGLAFYHLHLYRFVAPGPKKLGDLIGYTGGAYGAVGSGASTGPHLHANAYFNGAIHDVHDFFTETKTAGSSGTAIPVTPDVPKPKEDDMVHIYVQDQVKGVGSYAWIAVVGGGVKDGMFEVSPADRSPWERFKSVYNTAAQKMGERSIGDADMVGVDPTGYQSVIEAYRNVYPVPGAAGAPAVIDYAALAKAVNDDAARRLAS